MIENEFLGILCGDLGRSDMNNIYFFNFDNLIALLISSFIISIILHNFFNTNDFHIPKGNEVEIIEIRQYSLVTKTLTIFFILVLLFMPIFKLLNTGYFL